MNVRELKAILEHVPDELPVHVISDRWCAHIAQVERTIAGRNRRGATFWPSSLVLRGGPVWFDPEPPTYELRGPYRRKSDLLRALDALEGAP